MSFRSGGISAIRFSCKVPAMFGQEHLDRLADRQIGHQRVATDGIEVGWAGGGNVLDAEFDLEKNIINDSLHFDLRVTKDVLPSDLLKAYYETELKALVKNNPSGFPSAKQKREAKESARERLEDESKDGRFQKHRLIPVMWDRPTNKLYFGSNSITSIDKFTSLFEQTFGVEMEIEAAGWRAVNLIGPRDGDVDRCSPSNFIAGSARGDTAWIADESSRDFLGNEFLLWLWYWTDVESDTFTLSDSSEVTIMFQKTLLLDCPRSQTGVDVFRHEGPTRLPEARRAIQSGKLPRRAAFTMVRHDTQYEFGFSAETFAIQSAKVAVEEDVVEARAKLDRRIELWRELNVTVDLLYDRFLSIRCTGRWADQLASMQKWLERKEVR